MSYDERSFIEPEKVKSESEGKGQYYAALGKEIDEHNILLRKEKRATLTVVLVFIGVVVIFGLISLAIPNFMDNWFDNTIKTHEAISSTRGIYQDKNGNNWEYKPSSNEIERNKTNGPN